jgi:hypothetical protein
MVRMDGVKTPPNALKPSGDEGITDSLSGPLLVKLKFIF